MAETETLQEAQLRASGAAEFDVPKSSHYLRGLRKELYKIEGGFFHCITRQVFRDIATYQTSTPTGPSPGRIYKRQYKTGWTIFICVNDDVDPAMVKHVPFRCIIEPDVNRDAVTSRFTDC